MGVVTAIQIPPVAVGDVFNVAVSFAGQLDSGEVLTGTPTITEVTSTDLTISNKAVNSAAITVNGTSVAIGGAVQCKVLGQLLATREYTLKIVAVTDSTPAQTLNRYVKFRVER